MCAYSWFSFCMSAIRPIADTWTLFSCIFLSCHQFCRHICINFTAYYAYSLFNCTNERCLIFFFLLTLSSLVSFYAQTSVLRIYLHLKYTRMCNYVSFEILSYKTNLKYVVGVCNFNLQHLWLSCHVQIKEKRKNKLNYWRWQSFLWHFFHLLSAGSPFVVIISYF